MCAPLVKVKASKVKVKKKNNKKTFFSLRKDSLHVSPVGTVPKVLVFGQTDIKHGFQQAADLHRKSVFQGGEEPTPALPLGPVFIAVRRSRILQWIGLSVCVRVCVCSRDQPEAARRSPASCLHPNQTANSFQSHVSNMGNRASVQWAADMC